MTETIKNLQGRALESKHHQAKYRKARERDEMLRRSGADFTDSEGNYWGHMFNSDGKRIRICIPVD